LPRAVQIKDGEQKKKEKKGAAEKSTNNCSARERRQLKMPFVAKKPV
jgi:hypothetical protein